MKNEIIYFIKKIRAIYYTYLYKRRLRSCGKNLVVNHRSKITGKAEVEFGNFCNLNGMIIAGDGEVRIGNYFHSGFGCLIMLGSHDYDNGDHIPYGKSKLFKKVTIGDSVWLGANVTISGNVKIGEGAIVSVGSIVVKDVPPYAIVGGNPAQIIKYRDIDHFKKLKAENKFF